MRSIRDRRGSPYRIRSVDGDDYAFDIAALLEKTELPRPKGEYDMQWWLAFFEDHPIAYLGIMRSLLVPQAAYLIRVGVLAAHRGNALQLRLMLCAERWARRQGFASVVSDTTFNPPSANNFIRAGYQTWAPPAPWAFPASIYWRKNLG